MICLHKTTRTRFFLIALVAALTTSCSVEAVPSDSYPVIAQAVDSGTRERQSEEPGPDGKPSEADDNSRLVVAAPHTIAPGPTTIEPVAPDASLVLPPGPFYVPQGPPHGP